MQKKKIRLPETDFLRGKVMILHGVSEERSQSAGEGSEVELSPAKFKPLSAVRGVVKAPRRGHKREDHYRTLATCH